MPCSSTWSSGLVRVSTAESAERYMRFGLEAQAQCRATLELRCLPASVLGPVDDSHGCQRLIASAWRSRRSGVHPFDTGPPKVRLAQKSSELPRTRGPSGSCAVLFTCCGPFAIFVSLALRSPWRVLDGRQRVTNPPAEPGAFRRGPLKGALPRREKRAAQLAAAFSVSRL